MSNNKTYCLLNTRGIRIKSRCRNNNITFTKDDHKNGLRISGSTFGFTGREKKNVLVTNEYIFGDVRFVINWKHLIYLSDNATSIGEMTIRPSLVNIYYEVDSFVQNYSIENESEKEIIDMINKNLPNVVSDVKFLELDQLEYLTIRPDIILEMMVQAARDKFVNSKSLRFDRYIPDYINLYGIILDD